MRGLPSVVKGRGIKTGKRRVEGCDTSDRPKWTAQSRDRVGRNVGGVRGKRLAFPTARNGRPSAVEVLEG